MRQVLPPSSAKSSNSPTWRISEQAADLERAGRRCRCNGRSQTVGNRKKLRIARIGAPPGQAARVDLRGRRPANNADRLGTRQRREQRTPLARRHHVFGFYTGDVGWMDPDGFLTISDRVKEMIISGGENVYSSTHTSFLMNPKTLTQNPLEYLAGAALR